MLTYRGNELDEHKAEVMANLKHFDHMIAEYDPGDLPIVGLTTSLVISITETKDSDILDLATDVCANFITRIAENLTAGFETEQLPTIFSALQLFAVEAGQYDFETTENPDSRINNLTRKYENNTYEYTRAKREYENAQIQLEKAKLLRGKAITALIELLKRNEFEELNNHKFIKDELNPLIESLNDYKRYRPFRVAQATKIGDLLYKFAHRVTDKNLRSLLQALYDKKQIRFGTSGFRAFINKDFTQYRSDIISLAICKELKLFQNKGGKPVVITYDTRINAREFAMESAKVFLAQGFLVKFAEEATPTGALVHWLMEEEKNEAAGGENMTPSHNPLSTQGQRWNLSNGDVAPTSVTDRIERGANLINLRNEAIEKDDIERALVEGRFAYINMKDTYTNWVSSFLNNQSVRPLNRDDSQRIALTSLLREFYCDSDHRFIHNAMNGAARGYVTEIFEKIGVPVEYVYPMDSYKDEFLGQRYYANPEEQWIVPTSDKLISIGALFESATDTDGDRCGGILDKEEFINLNKLMPLVLDFVIRGLGWEDHMAIRTGTTSTALDHVVTKLKSEGYRIETPEIDQVNSLVQHPFYDVVFTDENINLVMDLQKFPSIVTEVGFKYISASMKKCGLPAAVAGEESGGFTIEKIPDKDGIIGICLIASMIAWHGKKPSEVWKEHMDKYGEIRDKRLDIWVSDIPKEDIINNWLNYPPSKVAEQKVIWVGGTRYDKVELILMDTTSNDQIISRLTIRASGTEEMNRVYIESSNDTILNKLGSFILNEIHSLIIKDIRCSANYYELADKISSNGLTFMDEHMRASYFEAIRQRMDELAESQGITDKRELYRRILKFLSIYIDRDINIRHAAWDVDIGMEYYRHIFSSSNIS